MKYALIMAIAVSGGMAWADIAYADADTASTDPDQRIVTDFRGKPPFARRVERGADANAQRNNGDESAGGERVQVVERRGAPPFDRRLVDREVLEQAEFARFEETRAETRGRRGPPGKLTSRR